MATTRIIPLHINKGQTLIGSLADSLNYIMNPEKTDGGVLVSYYGCSQEYAPEDFAMYLKQCAPAMRKDSIIAYHLRQSFKPNEITPEGVCYKRCFNNIENMRSSRLVCGRISDSVKGG